MSISNTSTVKYCTDLITIKSDNKIEIKLCPFCGQFSYFDIGDIIRGNVDDSKCLHCNMEPNHEHTKDALTFAVRATKRMIENSDLMPVKITGRVPSAIQLFATCKTCGKSRRYNNARLRDFVYSFNRFSSCQCCPMDTNEAISPEFNKANIMIGVDNRPYKFIDRYTMVCEKGHHSNFNFSDRGSLYKHMQCYICKAFEEYEFFRLLDELGIIYKIKEEFPRPKSPRVTKDGVCVKAFTILTANKARHLTGKIVFEDPGYTKENKARQNKIVFKTFNDLSKLNDRQYCLNFFGKFFDEINQKFGLSEEKGKRA